MPSWVERIARSRVSDSDELKRVLSLPRRPVLDLDSARAKALVVLMTERLRRPDRPPGAPCGCAKLGRKRCINTLLPTQAWTLFELGMTEGLLGPQGVGSGKTLNNLLAPMVIKNCRKAALFVPPGLIQQLHNEYKAAGEHFKVPSLVMPDGTGTLHPGRPSLYVVPYSKFSRPESTVYLEMLEPDLIIADEAHCLKNVKSARGGRVARYFAAHPETRFCCWSGTLTSKSLNDFAHLAAWSLGMESPLPVDPDEWEKWAAVVDPSDWPAPPGALSVFGEDVREGLRRRIFETRGVVSTRAGALPGCSIIMKERPAALPKAFNEIIRTVKSTMTRPDGEEFLTALEVSACVEQLICGFYYRWRFPDKPDPKDVDAWFAARKAWGSEMREKLKSQSPHLDSPKLLANAAERFVSGYRCGDTCRGTVSCKLAAHLPVWESETWVRWRDVKDTIRHVTETVWVDDYMVQDAVAWGKKHRGIIWSSFSAFGHKVAEVGEFEYHGGGPGAEARILATKGDRTIVASVDSHGTGRDGLQHKFDKQLITCPMASGLLWEQLLGRLHRQGQEADEVETWVYRHVPEWRGSLDQALIYAKWIDSMTDYQRLLSANIEWAIAV
jgi:hypothetical protein